MGIKFRRIGVPTRGEYQSSVTLVESKLDIDNSKSYLHQAPITARFEVIRIPPCLHEYWFMLTRILIHVVVSIEFIHVTSGYTKVPEYVEKYTSISRFLSFYGTAIPGWVIRRNLVGMIFLAFCYNCCQWSYTSMPQIEILHRIGTISTYRMAIQPTRPPTSTTRVLGCKILAPSFLSRFLLIKI